jgi:hypothetical protein
MTSTRDTVSPVLDTTRLSLIVVANKVNSPGYTYTNQSGIDDSAFVTADTTVAITTTGLSTVNAGTQATFLTADVGRYLTISGATTHSANNGTYKITAVAADGSSITLNATLQAQSAGDTITITQGNTFVDDIAPFGSSTISNYVTKKINLNTAANTLKVTLSVNSPTNSSVAVYYKVNPVGNATPFSTLNYTLLSPDTPLPKVQFGDNTYTDVNFTLSNTSPFDAMQVKLVLTSTNGSEITSVKDLRVIACT